MLGKLIAGRLRNVTDLALNTAQLAFYRDAIERGLAKTLGSLVIETTNICNANCTFCGYQFQERATGKMSMAVYQKVVDELVECGGKYVLLSGTVGDPLVDGMILNRIAYARRAGVSHVEMFSNMISLRRHRAAELVESGLSKLNISISGLDEAMYHRVYRSTQYQKVIQNIRDLIQANDARGKPIDIRLSMRVDRPLREVYAYPDFVEIQQKLGPEKIDVNLFFDDWAGRVKQEVLTGSMKVRSFAGWLRPKVSACVEFYSGLTIYWDGKVGACGCRDLDATELIVGDARTSHLAEIWFGKELERLRREFTTPARKEICTSCKHYNNLSLHLQASQRAKWEHPLDSRALYEAARAKQSDGDSKGPRRLPVVPDV